MSKRAGDKNVNFKVDLDLKLIVQKLIEDPDECHLNLPLILFRLASTAFITKQTSSSAAFECTEISLSVLLKTAGFTFVF